MECVLLLVVLLDLACSVLTTQGKPGSTLQMEFPNSPEGHHPATMSSFFPAVSFSPSSRDNMVKTSQVESSTLILPSLSKADVKGKLPSVKSELGVMNSKTEDFVQRIETELTPKVTFSRSASLTQTSVSPTSEVTASTSSVLSQVSGVGASSGLFQMQVASSHLQNNNATATLSTVRVEGRSTLMLTQGLSAINEQNVVTASKIIQSTTTSLQFSASGRDSLSLESKGVSSFKAQSTLHTHQLLPQTASRSNVQSILSASLSIRRTVQLVTSVGVASSLTSEPAFSPDIRASPMQTDGILTKTVLTSHVKNMSTANATAYTTARTFQLATSQIITPSVISEGESMTGVSQSKIKTDQVSALTVLTSEVYKMSSSVLIAHNQESHFAGSQGSLASLASDVSSNVARMSTVQIDLGQSQAQISRSASSSVLHVVTLSSLLPVQSLTTWKPSFTQSKVANTSIPSRSVSVHKMSHSSSHMAQSGMVISPTNQSVHPILSASAPVSRFIHGMKAESSSSHLQDVSLIFNTSQVSTLPMTRRSVPKSTHTSSEKSLYSIGMSSASIKMPNSSESVSYKKIDPTTTYAPVSMTSWYPSSSVFLLPPTAVPGKPDAPVIQSAKVLSANGVYLKWNATNIQSFVNFSIDFSQDAVAWVQATCNNSLVQVACVVNQTEAVVLLLKPFTNYTFRVMAKSRFGNSNYSLESQWVLTGEAAPSGSPVITTAHNVSSTEIVVAWKPPPLQTLNGKLRSYEVQITELKGTPTSLPTEVTVSSSSSSFGSSAHVSYPTREPHMLTTAAAAVEGIQQVGVPVSLDAKLNLSIHIAELKKWSNYLVRVRAHTVAAGPFSDAVVVRTDEDAPTGPPRNVRALTISSSSISLFWMPPEPEAQNGPITGYSIFVKGDSESTKHFKVTAGMMAYNATGLRPYTNYTFQMQALNVMGVGPNSSTVMNTTFQAAPTGFPRNVRALTISSSSISLFWMPPEPEEQNGPITGYNIFVKGDSEPTKLFKVAAGMMAYNATGLRPYTNYTFRMQALNIMGVGPNSSTFMNTTFQAAPTGPPRNVRALAISSSSISLFWMPPEPEEQNGPITGYNIFVKGDSESTKHFKVTAGMMAYNATGLRPYTNYTFQMQALNVMGVGPNSSTVMNTTFQAVPSPPRNVTAQSLNSTAIKVTWVEALHPNGIISYKVYKRRSVEKEDADQQIYDGLDTVYIAAGLEEYVKYTFTVVSLNVKYQWTSQRVIAMETTHPTEPSGPPQNVRALALSPTSIRVIWNPPLLSQRNGIISHYTVRFTSQFHQPKSVNTTDNNTSIVISDLAIFTTYSFTIKAWNVIGAGPESEAVDNTTWEDLPSAPQDLRAWNLSESSVFVTWREPSHVNGNLKGYKVYYKPASDSKFMSREVGGKTTQVTLHFLTPFTLYNVKVLAVTGAGGGNASAVTVTTDETVPSAPQDLRAWNLSESSVFVNWGEPSHVNGNLKGYKVYYEPASRSELISKEKVVKTTQVTLDSLVPFTLYSVEVIAVTGAGGGNASAVTVMTDETAPSHDIQLKVLKFDSRSIELSWTPPSRRNGKIGYFLSYWKFQGSFLPRQDLKSIRLPGKITSKVVRELKPYSEYKFEIVAYNLRKNSNASAPNIALANTTAEEPSGPPRNVRIINTTSDSITLSWDPPLEPNGKILGYKVKYFEKGKPDKDVNDHLKENVYIITALKPYRFYKIHVACRSSGGIGPASPYVEQQTKAGEPPPLGTLAPPDKRSIKSNSFIVRLTKASNEMGEVKYYQVIVRELATDNRNKPVPLEEPDSVKPKDLYTYDEARRRKPKLVPYIAAQFPAREFDLYENFVVGAGSKGSSEAKRRRRRRRVEGDSQEYYNGPLEENTYYAVFQRAYVSEDVYSSSDWTEPVTTAAIAENKDPPSSTPIGMIVGLILVIVIVALLILVVIYFVRRKRGRFDRVMDDRDDFTNGQPVKMKKLSRKRKSIQKKLMGSIESLNALEDLAASRAKRQPVPIDDFERHVSRMHMDGDHGFSEEYSLVQPDEEFSFQQFLNPANKYKNRYANIVAYDHTRVLLNPLEGVAGSDYINANFIDGYNRQRAYIAAQGPLMETFDDFWRMIWEQMSSVIVMLTKLEERGRRKCDQYWPERGTKSHGQIQVTLKETLNMSHYTLRKFIITHKQFPDDDRLIKQFHFTAWPDHGVPSHPTPLLSLVRHSYNANRQSVGPMVVHCSAGVGRTGTFITLDVMLQRISQEDSIDVFGFVRQMRYQRNFMVQTEAQYVFIHDAVLEAITCGVTEVEAKDLSFRIRELRQFDPETGYTYMENEFSRLAKEENHPIAFKSATLNCNAAKNRYANILPFESTRVHLKMRPGEMGSDYINANFIDGYCQPRAYIATQAPIPDTFEDFWRLIWEQESATVVMLTREEEAGKIKCHHYWPTEGSRLYGVILVELIEETSFGDYFSRKFKLTHTEEKDSHTVCQFHYTDWPDIGVPDSGVGIVDLIGQVQKWQQHSGNTSIVIHCSGGVGRTGVFCGISMMIERLKSEGVVDVFQTVQAMRLQRPAMVQTAEQYDFCYTTLQEYLDSFDLYANFQ
ncbi:receptor-type tyrosine-protein phosphatase delta-like isoform X6 [Acropora millepora]|uniref:receptor-type tyrosine-protein phosphatase delta-like isoform X6 n=1 Tax=Acropora millepora TaxID=45264 RepID=UPI001CF502F4|nr:receptor-type tyrosine-protein phosphatase delta-like isoform X6 [Acropora millepora]